MPTAAGLADKIMKRFYVTPNLLPSGGGVFEIYVNRKKVYSKKQTGEFPTDEQVFQLIDDMK
ncbi:MAG: Rdx family protein [Deltaproteobacteria bacterium]|nr:Rdx family protein [Deltaproteobacteria bacterium]